MTKPKQRRKPRVIKTRGGGTLTESAFWTMIRSALRQRSRWWKPNYICKEKSRRLYKGPRKRQKYEYRCNICKEWFPEKDINIDHIIPVGQLNCSADLPGFVERLFCEEEGLQVACKTCHDSKTKIEKTKNNEND